MADPTVPSVDDLFRAAGLGGEKPPQQAADAAAGGAVVGGDGSPPGSVDRLFQAAGLGGGDNQGQGSPDLIDPDTGVPLSVKEHPWLAHISNITGAVIDGLPWGHSLRQLIDSTIAQTPEAQQRLQQVEAAMKQEHPYETMASNVIGNIAGYGALMTAAPEAFGMGALAKSPMLVRAGASALGNMVIAGTDALSRGDDPKSAAIYGAVMGGVQPKVAAVLGKVFANTVIPKTTELYLRARNVYGIDTNIADATNNTAIRFLSGLVDMTPGAGSSAPAIGESLAQWRSAIARNLIGEDTPAITDKVLASAKKRMGAGYDAITAQASDSPLDRPFLQEWMKANDELTGSPTQAWVRPELAAMRKMTGMVRAAFEQNGGSLTPQAYASLTNDGSYLSNLIRRGSPNVKPFAADMKKALDDLLDRNLSPDLAARKQVLDRQYWGLNSIEPLIAQHPDGAFSPEEFARAALKNVGGKAYGQGGSFAELADIGQLLLKSAADPDAEKGVIARLMSRKLRFGDIAGAGILYHGVMAHPVTALASAAAIPAIRGLGAVMRSRWAGNRLARGALGLVPHSRAAQILVHPGARILTRGALPGIAQAARPYGIGTLQNLGVATPPGP